MSEVTYYPERDQWTLSDDQHWLEVPKWARGIIRAQHERETRPLRNENAELRELVADLWRFTGTACKKYPRLFDQSAQGGQTVMLNMLDSFEHRMRELGVEVDG
jgi:hypothetical protein